MAISGGQAKRQSVDLETIARLLCLTERRIQQLAKDGIVAKADYGKYYLVESVQGYIKFLQEAASGLTGDSNASRYGQARTQLAELRARREELNVRRMAGELAPVADMEEAWAALVVRFRARLLSLPAKLAPRLRAARTNIQARDALKTYIESALDELSRIPIDPVDLPVDGAPEPDPAAAPDSGDDGAAARPDGEPVGG